ncbi:hypothetical protein J6590_103125 [Homalodisca vitripennis]|nr:hypothetical protein J6590_103125 [Homalodisca vitripennis]
MKIRSIVTRWVRLGKDTASCRDPMRNYSGLYLSCHLGREAPVIIQYLQSNLPGSTLLLSNASRKYPLTPREFHPLQQSSSTVD